MGDVLGKTKYLEFVDATPVARKTKVVWVRSLSSGERLGTISWYGPWRQYSFYPTLDTIWNDECLQDVRMVIAALMAAREAT